VNKHFIVKLILAFLILILNDFVQFIEPVILTIAVFGYIIYLFYDEINLKKIRIDQLIRQYQQEMNIVNKESSLRTKQLESIVSNINFPMVLINQHAQILLVNDNFLKLNNITEIKQLHENSPLDTELRNFMREAFLKEISSQKTMNIKQQDYSALSIPIYENGRYMGCLYIFQNITYILERERIQKRFIADASHELKTPVSAIKGMIEILNRPNFKDEETLLDFHQQIEIEAKRMENIIQDMLTLSRNTTKNVLLNIEQFNPYQLINDVIRSQQSSIQQKRIVVENNLSKELNVDADRDKFYHIFSNLLSNAIKSSERGTILFESSMDDRFLSIMIHDEGIGMHPAEIPYIFERYYRIDESRSRNTGGSGLGLAIVKTYVNAHQGTIEVQSIEGKGSTFTCNFPIKIVKKA
jgi:two-component system phosphate regulon sensor histidine kinase PhoR